MKLLIASILLIGSHAVAFDDCLGTPNQVQERYAFLGPEEFQRQYEECIQKDLSSRHEKTCLTMKTSNGDSITNCEGDEK